MKNIFDKERLLQMFILLGCLIILIFRFSSAHSNAQTPCLPNKPPLIDSANPKSRAWAQYKEVSVVIFDRAINQPTSQDEFDAIDASIRDWNNVKVSGCSNVTFKYAERAGRPWNGTESPNNGTVYVVRTTDRDGQFVPIRTASEVIAGFIYMNSNFNLQTRSPHQRVDNLAKHEAGHSFGIANGNPSDPPSVMSENSQTMMTGNTYVITECDIAAQRRVYCPMPTATPTPTPNPTPTPSYCFFPVNYALYPATGCPAGRVNQAGCCACSRSDIFIQQCLQNNGDYDPDLCGCTGSCGADGSCSPIVIDISGNGFSLTNAANGVSFDLAGTGNPQQCGWTAIDSDEAWLALDRNQNQLIDNGSELFGNVTAQEPQTGIERNGFLALGEYDKPMNGGNNDGVISNQDFIFTRLRLWQDSNHNGISEANELKTLSELNLENIELDYKESRKTDPYGNQFKYRAKVRDALDAQINRWAWDVFLVTEP